MRGASCCLVATTVATPAVARYEQRAKTERARKEEQDFLVRLRHRERGCGSGRRPPDDACCVGSRPVRQEPFLFARRLKQLKPASHRHSSYKRKSATWKKSGVAVEKKKQVNYYSSAQEQRPRDKFQNQGNRKLAM